MTKARTLADFNTTAIPASAITGLTSSDNTPNFKVYRSGGYQTYGANASNVLVAFDGESWDSDNAVSNSVFTVPTGEAGLYCFTYAVGVQDMGSDQAIVVKARKNDSTDLHESRFYNHRSNTANLDPRPCTFTANLAAGDTVDIRITTPSTVGVGLNGEDIQYFEGFKLAE